MEGRAIEAALKNADGQECEIFTDSEFWVNVITKWGHSWKANNWSKKGGDIQNLDIVQEVFNTYHSARATITWVRGHVGNPENEAADVWANKAREEKLTGNFLYTASDKK